MIEENMLRGSLTSTQEAKGGLGFKGERGYSNYELYVLNGGTMTEEEWLDHFGVDLTDYAKTSEVEAITGDLEELETTDKTDLVSAINEHQGSIEALDERGIYSTTEKVVGTWLGKPIYRKVINFGALPDTSSKSVNHNISNLGGVRNLYGMCYRSLDGLFFPLPSASTTLANNIQVTINGLSVIITTGIDRTNIQTCYVIVEYTKTTD